MICQATELDHTAVPQGGAGLRVAVCGLHVGQIGAIVEPAKRMLTGLGSCRSLLRHSFLPRPDSTSHTVLPCHQNQVCGCVEPRERDPLLYNRTYLERLARWQDDNGKDLLMGPSVIDVEGTKALLESSGDQKYWGQGGAAVWGRWCWQLAASCCLVGSCSCEDFCC